jgi:hypothetical protein
VNEIGLTLNDFINAADRFTNKDLFSRSLNSPRPVPLFEVV